MTNRRVLPNDTEAEASILGGVLLRNDVLALLPDLELRDFYDPRHQAVFEAMRNLSDRATPIDTTTVEFELARRDKLDACGGIGFLGELLLRVPTADHVVAYAAIVTKLSQARSMMLAMGELAEAGYTDGLEDADEYVAAAERKVLEISRRGRQKAARTIGAMTRDRMKQLEEIAARRARGEQAITGVPTGIAALDELMGGYRREIITVVAGRPKMGKAQPLDAKVLTPTGWTTMGSLSVGDLVIGAFGNPTRVVAVHERGELGVYRVEFAHGAATECCADHLWTTRTRPERRRGTPGTARRTEEILATLTRGRAGRANHFIPYVKPVEFAPSGDLPLDPYLLGLYIRDGHSAGNVMFTKPEPDIRAAFLERLPTEDVGVIVDHLQIRVKKRGDNGRREPSAFMRALRDLGLAELRSHEKFVPYAYRLGSVETRLAMLRGLFDTDGYVTNDRLIEFGTTSPMLRDDVVFIVGSLGGAVTVAVHTGAYRASGERHETRLAWRMRIRFPHGNVVPVSSRKHLAKWKPGPLRCDERSIRSITSAGRKVCRCITVDAPDGLYVTDDFLVTHNSSMGMAAADATTAAGLGVMVFSIEDGESVYSESAIARRAGVPTTRLRTAELERADLSAIAAAMADYRKRDKLWRFESALLDAPAICRELRRAKAEMAREGVDLALGIIDYLQLVKRPIDRGMTTNDAIAFQLACFAAIAKELGIALMILSQLNRDLEKRDDKRPTMPDLRGSGAIEEVAKAIAFVYRGAAYYSEPKKEIDYDCECPVGATWCNHRPSAQDFESTMQIIVAADNQGQTGRVFAKWHGPTKTVS